MQIMLEFLTYAVVFHWWGASLWREKVQMYGNKLNQMNEWRR